MTIQEVRVHFRNLRNAATDHFILCVLLLVLVSCSRLNRYEELDGPFPIPTPGISGYIDSKGKIVIGFRFDDATDFSEGLAAVENDGKWGYIDKQGEVELTNSLTLQVFFQRESPQLKLTTSGVLLTTLGE